MFRPRPQNTDNLTCDICGAPAKWRDRVFHSAYVLGDATCDECEKKAYIVPKPVEPLIEE